jgi:hypothetical protein
MKQLAPPTLAPVEPLRHPASASPVADVLRTPGRPLDARVRAIMEPRFGHDFSRVRVHADSRAAASAGSIGALAYTVGQDIVFGAGQFAPQTLRGQGLVAHELAHTLQQDRGGEPGTSRDPAERDADAAARAILHGESFRPQVGAPLQIARKDGDAPALPNPLSRTEFILTMKNRYRVATVRTGTYKDQVQGDLKESDWTSWDPGASSSTYNLIIDAFVNLEKALGGVPEVNEIVFFETRYALKNGKAEKDPKVGASFGAGQLTIYHAVETSNQMLTETGGLETPTIEQAVRRNITHELGHAIVESVHFKTTQGPPGSDDKLIDEYKPAVGWARDGNLYDIGEQVVKDAIKDGNVPPSQYHITPDNALIKTWKERPLTAYMTDNPSDDFAETIMAYVNEPKRLQALSKERYNFIDGRKSKWLASGQPKVNIWEQAKQGGSPRVLKPSNPDTIWDRARRAADVQEEKQAAADAQTGAFAGEDATMRARRLAAIRALRNAITRLDGGLAGGYLWPFESATASGIDVAIFPGQPVSETTAARAARLKQMLVDLNTIVTLLEGAPIPAAWLAGDATFPGKGTIGATGPQDWQDAQMFYAHQGAAKGMTMDAVTTNLFYLETDPIPTKKVRPAAYHTGVQLGIYIIVPDEKNHPLDYRRFDQHEGWNTGEAIPVWLDDIGHYYIGKDGTRHYLPDRP